MSPTHTRKRGRLYRYYVSQAALKGLGEAGPATRVSAAEIETAVINQIRALLRTPDIIIGTWRTARSEIDGLSEADTRTALERLDPLWDELFPAEQVRIVRLLVERVDLSEAGADISLRTAGLNSLLADLQSLAPDRRRAA